MAWIVASSLHASDSKTPPVLDSQEAMDIAIKLAREAAPSQNYSGQLAQFEPSTREWTMPIDVTLDKNSAQHFVARVNESTGLACLERSPATGCVVQEDIHKTLDGARAKADALRMAREYPAPDLQQMTEVLLRHQLVDGRSRKGRSSRLRLFVSLPSPDAKGLVDISPDIAARFMQDGIDIYPGTAWKPSTGNVSSSMQFSVGLPVRRSDGDYDVPYSYYCGALCAASYTAVMKHDADGWHLVSTAMNWIS